MSALPVKFFEVKPYHLRLLQRCYTSWDDCEFGAPQIDPKRPFGNSGSSSILQVVAQEAGLLTAYKHINWNEESIFDVVEDNIIKEARRIYEELEICLQILLNDLAIVPGKYRLDGYGKNWKYIGD